MPVTFGIGTDCYKAPEVVQTPVVEDEDEENKNKVANIDSRPFYSHKVDLWSLGCVIFSIATRKKLFPPKFPMNDDRAVKERVRDIKNRLKGTPLRGSGVAFVQKMIVIDPKKRPRHRQGSTKLE